MKSGIETQRGGEGKMKRQRSQSQRKERQEKQENRKGSDSNEKTEVTREPAQRTVVGKKTIVGKKKGRAINNGYEGEDKERWWSIQKRCEQKREIGGILPPQQVHDTAHPH